VLFGLGLLVAVAAAMHLAALWAAPRLIMQRALSAAAGPAPPAPVLPPPTDHHQRRIVMPSPDLLYAVCVWDVAERPLRIRADLRGPRYASVALYAANSDNFFVVNDRAAGDAPLQLRLVGPQAGAPNLAGVRTVRAPSARGLLLMRVLVGDPAADLAAAEAARATLRCEPE
jgi:uncharacterized membrane protein